MTREKAIKNLELSIGTYEALEIGEEELKMAIEALKEQRPQGEWVESKERKGHFYCSECVQQDKLGKWRELFDYKYNFCPNCGASMSAKDRQDTGKLVEALSNFGKSVCEIYGKEGE